MTNGLDKIKTDVVSVRANLLKEIQPADYVIVENRGAKYVI